MSRPRAAKPTDADTQSPSTALVAPKVDKRTLRHVSASERRTAAEVQAIVDRIADEMRTGRWLEASRPYARLAEELGCSQGYIGQLSARAWDLVRPRLDPEETERLRSAYVRRLESIAHDAHTAGEFRAAAAAIDTAAKVQGLYQPGLTMVFTGDWLAAPKAPAERKAVEVMQAAQSEFAAAVLKAATRLKMFAPPGEWGAFVEEVGRTLVGPSGDGGTRG